MKTLLDVWIALLLTAASAIAAQPDTTHTPLRLLGLGAVGVNMHTASFQELPGVPNCCATFEGGSGLGFALGAGLDVAMDKGLFGLSTRLGLFASYSSLGAQLTAEEFVGNIISGQDVFDGTVKHTLDAAYSTVTVEPFIALGLPGIERFELLLGLAAGFPIAATYEQAQELISPADPAYTFENGSRTRNQSSGPIPDKNAFYAAVNIGVRYDVPINASWSVAPLLQYQYAITPVVSSLDWNAYALRVGFHVAYRLPKASPPPPPPPPPPTPPPPPPVVKREPVLQLDLAVAHRGAVIPPGSDAMLKSIRRRIVDSALHVPPIVFFDRNSTLPAVGYGADALQQDVLTSVGKLMRENPNATVDLLIGVAADEDPSLGPARELMVITLFDRQRERVRASNFKYHTQPKYPQLLDEQRFVRVEVVQEQGSEGYDVSLSHSTYEAMESELSVMPVLTCEAGPCDVVVEATWDGRPLEVRPSGQAYAVVVPAELSLASMSKMGTVVISGSIKDSTGRIVRAERTIRVRAVQDIVTRDTVSILSSGTTERRVLGYFEFDGRSFSTVDRTTLDLVRKAIAAKKKVTIVPGADDLGSPEYNRKLQQDRAEAALRLLNVTTKDVRIRIEPTTPEQNSTPMQRIANRAVRVEIEP
jgi:outer membrane protein OmpA-like peptidoglycan-associated protein